MSDLHGDTTHAAPQPERDGPYRPNASMPPPAAPPRGSVPSRLAILRAIVVKDLRAFFRDRFWLAMTALAIVWFAVIYYFLPDTVDETIQVGVHWTETDAAFDASFAADEGIEFVRFDTSEELENALGLGEEEPDELLEVGVDFPADFLVHVTVGMSTSVRLYVDPGVPDEIRDALSTYVRESAFALTGHPIPVTPPDEEVIVIGEDRVGDQVPLREKMRPLLVFFMLIMEVFALGVLIADEIRTRTVTAVLATPARVLEFLTAKGIVGTTVAFSEALLLLILLRAFGEQPLIVLLTLALGAVLVTGISLIVGASGRDFISLIFYSLMFIVPMVIPAIAVLFPGSVSLWIKLLPTYGLVQALMGAGAYGDAWSDLLPYLMHLLLWCGVVAAAGLLVLRRKVVAL